MKQQITDRGDDVDAEWLRRLRAAQRATTNVYHRALEKRDSLNGERSVAEAILAAVIDQNDDELMARLHRWVAENTPHLAGVDLAAAKHLLV